MGISKEEINAVFKGLFDNTNFVDKLEFSLK